VNVYAVDVHYDLLIDKTN